MGAERELLAALPVHLPLTPFRHRPLAPKVPRQDRPDPLQPQLRQSRPLRNRRLDFGLVGFGHSDARAAVRSSSVASDSRPRLTPNRGRVGPRIASVSRSRLRCSALVAQEWRIGTRNTHGRAWRASVRALVRHTVGHTEASSTRFARVGRSDRRAMRGCLWPGDGRITFHADEPSPLLNDRYPSSCNHAFLRYPDR